MYTACALPNVKERILRMIPCDDGTLRVIVATIAFGMGLDCPNIRKIIHWGPSGDIESYIQETRRAGRDGEFAEAILYYNSRDLGQVENDNMKDYCKNKSLCRREMLLRDFDRDFERSYARCSCCDICKMQCECTSCMQ